MTFTPAQLQALQQGGLVGFAGGTNPFKAGLFGSMLSVLIKGFTKSKLSHVGIVPPMSFWPATGIDIMESTEWQGVSGPQLNDLASRLDLDYAKKGGHAWFLAFRPAFAPDWPALWAHFEDMFALVKAGKLHYSVARLFADAVDRNLVFAALPLSGILQQLSEHDKGVVCSECAGLLMTAGGVDRKVEAAYIPWLPNVEPVAGQPIGCAPQDLWEMPIWQAPVTLL